MNSLLICAKQLRGALIALIVIFASPVLSQENILLTVGSPSDDLIIELTEEDLLAMEQFSVFTENEFVDGLVEFTGPLARDVIALLENDGIETLRLTAVNDYAVEIPMSDLVEFDVIFAMAQDATRLSVRDKGPIWVIYPMSDHTELQDRVYNDRLIWQLVKVEAL